MKFICGCQSGSHRQEPVKALKWTLRRIPPWYCSYLDSRWTYHKTCSGSEKVPKGTSKSWLLVGMWIWSRLVLCWAGERGINDSWNQLAFSRAGKAAPWHIWRALPPAPSTAEALCMELWWSERWDKSCYLGTTMSFFPEVTDCFLGLHKLIALSYMQRQRTALWIPFNKLPCLNFLKPIPETHPKIMKKDFS